MDTLLILLGVLGFGAIIIAIHVFSVDSDAYGDSPQEHSGNAGRDTPFRERERGDRRSGMVVVFPLLINGILLREDRRSRPDRRRAA